MKEEGFDDDYLPPQGVIQLERRPRTAYAIQLTAENQEECFAFIGIADAQLHGSSIIVRRNGTHIETLNIGEWALRGMDGKIRVMNSDEVWSKYRVLQVGRTIDELSHF